MKLSVYCNAHHYLSSSLILCRCRGSSNKRRSHPLKEEMILALYSFRENSEDNEDDMELDVDREADSSNWVDVVDRGGLLPCLYGVLQLSVLLGDTSEADNEKRQCSETKGWHL